MEATMELADIGPGDDYRLNQIAEILHLSHEDVVYFQAAGELECYEEHGVVYVTGQSACDLVEDTLKALQHLKMEEEMLHEDDWLDSDFTEND
jgi:hypothetical protein